MVAERIIIVAAVVHDVRDCLRRSELLSAIVGKGGALQYISAINYQCILIFFEIPGKRKQPQIFSLQIPVRCREKIPVNVRGKVYF